MRDKRNSTMVDSPAFRRWKRGEGTACLNAGFVGDALRSLTRANKLFNDPQLAEAIAQIGLFLDDQPERVRAFAFVKPTGIIRV